MSEASSTPKLNVAFGADLAAFEAGIKQVIASVEKLDAVIKRSSANFSRLGTSSSASAADINRMIAALNSNKRALEGNEKALQQNTAALDRFKGASNGAAGGSTALVGSLKGLAAGYLSFQAAISGAKAFVENTVEVGRFQKVLETASGTQKTFGNNMKFLESVADDFRLNILSLGKEFSSLSIATRGTALQGKETERIFRATSMAASALQMSSSQVTLTFKAFTDMISKGVVSSEELKRQLGNHLPGAFSIAARAMGVTTKELQKMLDDGKLLSSELLPKLATELEKTFGESAQKGAEYLGNNIEYAAGQMKLFFAEFSKASGAESALNSIAKKVGDIASSSRKALEGPLGAFVKMAGSVWAMQYGGSGETNYVGPHQRRLNLEKMRGYQGQHEEYLKQLKTSEFTEDKKKKTEFEKLIQSAEKLRGILNDQILKGVKTGRELSIPEKTIEKWNTLYNILSKVSEVTGHHIPKSLQDLNEKINPALKNLINEDSNLTYGRPEKWDPPKPSPDLFAGQSFSDFLKLEIDVEKLWKKEDIYKVEERLKKLRDRLTTQLIDTYGSLDDATQAGWGTVINSTKKGADGILEATGAIGNMGQLGRAIKNLENRLISEFGSLESASDSGWDGLIQSIKNGTAKLEDVVNGSNLLDLGQQFNSLIQGFAGDAAVGIGEALGTMMAGLDGAEASKRIGEVFGGLISNLGKAMIAFGTAKIAADESLKTMNAYVALAAGIAAVAAGAALKQTAQNGGKDNAQRFWTGGVVQGEGGLDRVPAWLTAGEMVLNKGQQTNLFRILDGNYGSSRNGGFTGVNPDINISVQGVLSGNNIALASERSVRSRNVHRGSLG